MEKIYSAGGNKDERNYFPAKNTSVYFHWTTFIPGRPDDIPPEVLKICSLSNGKS